MTRILRNNPFIIKSSYSQIIKFISVSLLTFTFSLNANGQVSKADSIKIALQGAWRMNADTNVVLVFRDDSMTHKMMRTSGMGRSRYRVTDKSCDTTRAVKGNILYLEETYRYYRNTRALEGKMCSKIISIDDGVLILERDGILETYTKLK
ncbi:MAG: hypothetical protein ACLQQ4_14355 [Bacteroidia bacterium]